MNTSLNPIRVRSQTEISIQRKIIPVLLSLFLGALLGFLAKYYDDQPVIGAIGTSLGVWVLIATILAAWSRSARAAALQVFIFFAAMLSLYYWYSMVLFGFFPRYYFIAWGSIALLSPIGAYIVWYARGNGWVAALCASFPIALLLVEGYRFFFTGSIPEGFDLLAAVLLIVMLGTKGHQMVRILLISLIVFLIFWKLHVLSLVFGGL